MGRHWTRMADVVTAARLFFVFYFFGTAIHGLHMAVGLFFVGWIIVRAWRAEFSPRYYTPVTVVGLYGSFVDTVLAYSLSTDRPCGAWHMSRRLRQLVLAWILLMVLLAIQIGVSFLPLGQSSRPLVLIPAVLMVAVVGTVFMEVGRGPEIIRLFAVAALLWLSILLGLGSLDPMTRIIYYVQTGIPE